MPIEIRQITIKAAVENSKEKTAGPAKEELDIKNINIENLLEEIIKKIKNKNER